MKITIKLLVVLKNLAVKSFNLLIKKIHSVNELFYDAFGQRIAGQENIPNRLRYNAQIEDDLTGLYYLRARYYNTGIGRFTQEDVIYNDGLNLYAHCSSNPVMYEDPSGYSANVTESVGEEK